MAAYTIQPAGRRRAAPLTAAGLADLLAHHAALRRVWGMRTEPDEEPAAVRVALAAGRTVVLTNPGTAEHVTIRPVAD